MLAVLVLGGISAMLLIKRGYFESLFVTIIVLGAVLLLLAWTWNPRLGFSGLGMFFFPLPVVARPALRALAA
ncbi:MAG: hypothetical protein M5R42_10370 [Rhodocyclaceae bacterium]|nr:hypothetical protein [Rhodocyclaceae bacterium]